MLEQKTTCNVLIVSYAKLKYIVLNSSHSNKPGHDEFNTTCLSYHNIKQIIIITLFWWIMDLYLASTLDVFILYFKKHT